jgi:peptidoglycan/LPS O-acetylase OafA/YrhL
MKQVWKLGGIPFQSTGAVVIALCLSADWLANWKEGGLFERVSQWLGNISYSTYLLHFPIQLALLIFTRLVHPLEFESAATLAAYAVLVMTLGALSFRFFEKPAKEWVLAFKSATR